MADLKANIQFSDAMLQALKRMETRHSLCVEVCKEFYRANPRAAALNEDIRDFGDIIPFSLDDSDEDIRRKSREYLEAYYDLEHPERRHALLDEFYDSAERFDIGALDLSVLEGKDSGKRGPHGLTASEADLVTVFEQYRREQARGIKAMENQAYYDRRYREGGKRALLHKGIDVFGAGFNSYFIHGLLPYNGLDQGFHAVPEANRETLWDASVGEKANTALALHGAQRMALGKSREELPVTLRLSAACYRKPGTEPEAAQLQAAEAVYKNVFGAWFSHDIDHGKRQGAIGVDQMDMIFVDGMTANEFLSRRFPDRSLTEQEKQQQLILSMQEGQHRYELGAFLPGADGQAVMQLSPVRVDLRGLDKAEKRAEHNFLRRMFDFGPFKIKTNADRQEALERSDPDKESRQQSLREGMRAAHAAGEARRLPVDALLQRMHSLEQQRAAAGSQAMQQFNAVRSRESALKKEQDALALGQQNGESQRRMAELNAERQDLSRRLMVADALTEMGRDWRDLYRVLPERMPTQEERGKLQGLVDDTPPTREDAELLKRYAGSFADFQLADERLQRYDRYQRMMGQARGNAELDSLLALGPKQLEEQLETQIKEQIRTINRLPSDLKAETGDISGQLTALWQEKEPTKRARRLAEICGTFADRLENSSEGKVVRALFPTEEAVERARAERSEAEARRNTLRPQAEAAIRRMANALVQGSREQPGQQSLSRQELLDFLGMEQDPLAAAPKKAPEVKAPEKTPEQKVSRVRASVSGLQQEEPEKPVRRRETLTQPVRAREKQAPEAGKGMGD